MKKSEIIQFVIAYLQSKDSNSETLHSLLTCIDYSCEQSAQALSVHDALLEMQEKGIVNVKFHENLMPEDVWTVGSSYLVITLNPLYKLIWTAKNKK
jgi:hypothetical protein